MNITLEIDDPMDQAGIAAARADYNARLPVAEGEDVADHEAYLATDEAYVRFVAAKAVASWRVQHGVS